MDSLPVVSYHVLARALDFHMVSPSSTRLDIRPLWRGSGVEIVATAWHRDRHPVASESRTEVAVIEFMLIGSFRKESNGEAVIGDANNVVVFRPGERFRVDHPRGQANTGLTIRLRDDAWRDCNVLACGCHAVPAAVFARVSGLAQRLHGRADDDGTCVEESVSQVLDALTGPTYGPAPIRRSAALQRVERNRVRGAQAYLNDVPDRIVSLTELAGVTDWSPWHLVRAFQRHTGLSPYRYHRRLRLRMALREVVNSRVDLTQLALRAGFSSHSHFTAAFRREFGAAPSVLRRDG